MAAEASLTSGCLGPGWGPCSAVVTQTGGLQLVSNPLYCDTNAYDGVREGFLTSQKILGPAEPGWKRAALGALTIWAIGNVKVLIREQPGPAVFSCKFVDESASARVSAAQSYWSPCSPSLISLMLELGPVGRQGGPECSSSASFVLCLELKSAGAAHNV